MFRFACLCLALNFSAAVASAATPVTITPVTAKHGVVVAGHPQAAEAGIAVLKAGGNAIDAAVATSLALGVAEPYGSGLGGKLMLLYYEAKSGRTFAVDAMDAAGSVDVGAYVARPDEDRTYGYGAVCIPGLGAGLWAAHQKWGAKKWADDIEPAIALARTGFTVLPKSRDFIEEQEKKLRRGDPEIARLYLPGGQLPEAGSSLPNEDLARTMELLARAGRDGFYRGPVAEAIVAASRSGGGSITLDDLARYEARIVEPITATFRGYTLVCAPPPVSGAALYLPVLKALESETFAPGPLRTAENLDKLGRVWRAAQPQIARTIGDAPESRARFEKLLTPGAIAALREKAFAPPVPAKKAASWSPGEESPFHESVMAATTHFLVADGEGNLVCATQSQSLHFGAGVVPPGTGVVLNNSMSNFTYTDAKSINFIAPGKRARSTIGPSIVLRDGRAVFALGVPGAARIPTAMLQALLDRLAFNRPLAEAIGDTRIHFVAPLRREDSEAFEAEQSLPAAEAEALAARGWKVVLPERAGRGRHFGGINAIEINADGTMTGLADPRRTNVAVGY
ncbi:MAG TPA: gamma-glutamyltransferase family protein [Opitutaceae bacterium]|nr:gamma-glutamyltransferase family protein [Opitutaceae bacterium]